MLLQIWMIYFFLIPNPAMSASFRLIFEEIRLIGYNQELLGNFHNEIKAKPPASFTVTYSYDVFKAINLDQARMTAKFYSYNKNTKTFILQPVRLVKRLCEEFKKKFAVDLSDMSEHGNVSGCGLAKPGYYQVKDYEPRLTLPDLKILTGRYKMNSVIETAKTFLLEVDIYARID